jgi:DNA-binding transcriptional LysR family regulator
MEQLNLVHLKYFYDAARTRSISKSAEINHVSQSAVSQGIAKLEQTIGISLIVHCPRLFQLTPKGLMLYKHSSAIFNQLESIREGLVENNLEVKMNRLNQKLLMLLKNDLNPVSSLINYQE